MAGITTEQLEARIRAEELHSALLLAAFICAALLIILPRRRWQIVLKRTLAHLDTQTKRKGALCLIAGLLLMVFGVLHRGVDYFTTNTIINSISFEQTRYNNELTFGIGFYLAITGLFLSFLYDWTIGPIISWVKNGS